MSGNFFGGEFFGGGFFGANVSTTPSTGGSKPRKRVRGPYSDPRIFEEYIKRCIAEREAPRASVAVAVLQESLVEVVDERANADEVELSALLRENQILDKLVMLEKTKRNVEAIEARQRQLERLIQQMQDEEMSMLLAIFDEM